VSTDSPAFAASSLADAGLEVLPPWTGSPPASFDEHDVAVMIEAEDAATADRQVRTILGVGTPVDVAAHHL
jgi:hypothetical protein